MEEDMLRTYIGIMEAAYRLDPIGYIHCEYSHASSDSYVTPGQNVSTPAADGITITNPL
jgi:hypothetical protein